MEHIISELPQASGNPKKKKKPQHATTLFEALATVKKERKYIFLYVLILASIEQLFKVDIIYKGNQG